MLLSVLLKIICIMAGRECQMPKKVNSCIASVFGKVGDKHMGTKTACKPYVFDRTKSGIAHRTLPCGTKVLIHLPRTGKWAEAEVLDRGPYGARMDDGSWGLKLRKSDPGIWRGCVDLTPPLSEALAHDGWDVVEVWDKR